MPRSRAKGGRDILCHMRSAMPTVALVEPCGNNVNDGVIYPRPVDGPGASST
jgi:hypothetical protein